MNDLSQKKEITMKTSKLNILLCLVATMVLSCGAIAYAADENEAQEKKEMLAKHEEFFKELGLSEEQQKTLKDNKKKNREEMKTAFQAMKEKRELMRNELQKETLDMNKINGLNEDLKKLQNKMADQKLSGILEVRKVLSPEQFKKFMEKTEKHMGRHGKGKM